MGGAYISCGSFEGEDKSGSPIQAVLEDLAKEATPSELEVISRINRLFDDASDHIVIETTDTILLTNLVGRYRTMVASKISPISDPFEQIERDLQASPGLDPTEAKYGKSVGWKYYCALDLERAVAVSVVESEPVIVSWD